MSCTRSRRMLWACRCADNLGRFCRVTCAGHKSGTTTHLQIRKGCCIAEGSYCQPLCYHSDNSEASPRLSGLYARDRC